MKKDYDLRGLRSRDTAELRVKHLKDFFSEDERALHVTTERIREYQLFRLEEGAQAGTVDREVAALRRMFTIAVKTGDGGEERVWSQRGDALYYRSGRQIMKAPIATPPEFRTDIARPLFERQFLNVSGRSYDVAPDREQFLILSRAQDSEPTEIRVVVNWAEELTRLVPVED